MRNKVFDNTSSKIFSNKSCPLSGKDAPIVDYKNIKLLKIEAEGAEPEVLSGAIATLKNTEYISVDYGNERGKDGLSTVVEVVNILISNNFEFIGDSNLRKVGLFRNRSFQI